MEDILVFQKLYFVPVLRIQICWICNILASSNRIRKNMRIHGSGSKGQKSNQKLQKKLLLFTRKSELLKRKNIKFSWFLNVSVKHKNKRKNLQKFENSALLKSSVNLKEITWIRIHFFQCGSVIRIRIKI